MDDVESRVIKHIKATVDDASVNITPESNLVDDLRFDSLDRIELAMKIEEEFSIEVDDAAADSFQTVGDIVRCVAGLVPK